MRVSSLSDGGPDFTLTQVAFNDTIVILAFEPIVGLLLALLGAAPASEMISY